MTLKTGHGVCLLTDGHAADGVGVQHEHARLVLDDEADGDGDTGVGWEEADETQAGRRELSRWGGKHG